MLLFLYSTDIFKFNNGEMTRSMNNSQSFFPFSAELYEFRVTEILTDIFIFSRKKTDFTVDG